MSRTAALITVKELDGRTLYFNSARHADQLTQALCDAIGKQSAPTDGISQRLTVLEAALRVQASAPGDDLGLGPAQLSSVIAALRALNAAANNAKHVFSTDEQRSVALVAQVEETTYLDPFEDFQVDWDYIHIDGGACIVDSPGVQHGAGARRPRLLQ